MANGDDELHPEPTFVRITNAMVYAELQATRADLRDLARTVSDYAETKKRVRALELKFYGVLAGLVAGVAALIFGPAAATAGIVVLPPYAWSRLRERNHERNP